MLSRQPLRRKSRLFRCVCLPDRVPANSVRPISVGGKRVTYVRATLLSYSLSRSPFPPRRKSKRVNEGSTVESSLKTASDTQSGRGGLRSECVVNYSCTFNYKTFNGRSGGSDDSFSRIVSTLDRRAEKYYAGLKWFFKYRSLASCVICAFTASPSEYYCVCVGLITIGNFFWHSLGMGHVCPWDVTQVE